MSEYYTQIKCESLQEKEKLVDKYRKLGKRVIDHERFPVMAYLSK